MNKKEKHRRELSQIFDVFLKDGDDEKIVTYLILNSDLPGRRANLELADAFAEASGDYSTEHPEKIWGLCVKLVEISPDDAPANDPKEFLPFCGTCAIGAVGSANPWLFEESLRLLRESAGDPRWRMREAVAFGIQKLLDKEREKTLDELERWVEDGECLAMRAVAAGVAEPSLLKGDQTAMRALELHEAILDKMLAHGERGSEEFRTLRKGLGYTLSVVISAIPNEGFKFVRRLACSRDRDILWIVRENLKKNRLSKNFPAEVASVKKLLE